MLHLLVKTKVLRCPFGQQSVNKQLYFYSTDFLTVWAAASLLPPPPTPYYTFFSVYPACTRAKTCLPCIN